MSLKLIGWFAEDGPAGVTLFHESHGRASGSSDGTWCRSPNAFYLNLPESVNCVQPRHEYVMLLQSALLDKQTHRLDNEHTYDR